MVDAAGTQGCTSLAVPVLSCDLCTAPGTGGKDAISKCSGQYDAANWLLSAEVSIFAADGCTKWDLPPMAEYKQFLTCRRTFRGTAARMLLTKVMSAS